MVEYVIELINSGVVAGLIHIERDKRITVVKPTTAGYSYCSKFRVKARAEKVASQFPNARLASTWGGIVYGSKSTVIPKQSKINGRPAYRSV